MKRSILLAVMCSSVYLAGCTTISPSENAPSAPTGVIGDAVSTNIPSSQIGDAIAIDSNGIVYNPADR